jgi:hypothetical protein
MIPGSLEANIENTHPGLCDHEFVEHYLKGNPSGGYIEGFIENGVKDFGWSDDRVLSEDLIPMAIFARGVTSGEFKKPLTDAQCLAISAYVKPYEWTGENCSVRSLSGVSKWMRWCWENTWQQKDLTNFDGCSVGLGSTAFFSGLPSNHPECQWTVSEARTKINPALISEAEKIVAKPQ